MRNAMRIPVPLGAILHRVGLDGVSVSETSIRVYVSDSMPFVDADTLSFVDSPKGTVQVLALDGRMRLVEHVAYAVYRP